MSTLPAPVPSICSIGLLDGFPCYRTGEFIMFSICSTIELFLHVLLLQHQILSSELYNCLTPQFLWHSSTKSCPTMEYAQLNIQKKKDVSIFHKDVSHRACKKYVYAEFWSRTYKSTRIGECAGMPGNYSISKLKRCRI